jgi:hypothetical protein
MELLGTAAKTKRGAARVKDSLWDEFQEAVQNGLVRHRSILDVTSKFQEASVRISRALAKSVTTCGCVRINAQKTQIPEADKMSLSELRASLDDHIEGELCPACREVIEEEFGRLLFYMAALADLLDVNIYDILIKEHKKLSALGLYNLL